MESKKYSEEEKIIIGVTCMGKVVTDLNDVDCKGCPYEKAPNCEVAISKDVLQLLDKKENQINTLADDIDRLKTILLMYDSGIIDWWRWIPVKEKLPENDRNVLITDGDGYAVGYWREDAQSWDSPHFGWLVRESDDVEPPIRLGKVTHWMYFPEFPGIE